MDRRELLRLSVAAGLAGQLAPAAEPTPDEAIHAYLAAEVERLSANFLDGTKTKAEWEARRPELRRQFLDMAGLDPLPERTPLKATVTGTLDRGGVTIEKLHFQSRPGLYVTGNLYRPTAGGAKLPAVLYVCGHSNRGRDGNKSAFQDHGYWFAQNGYVCLVIDTLQLGEVAGQHHGTYNLGRFWWHSRGYTPAGVECWNGMRAIDYLCSRPEVDPERIGVTGISGGGATTVWVAAADERVKVAVPVSGMSDLESYVTNRVVNGHCDCMFVHNTYRWEWTTILALFAPKPLLFANSDADPIFPMDGNRRIVARLRQCYAMLGAKDAVDEHVSPGGHDYRPDLRLAVFGFFHKHLKRDGSKVADATDPKIPGKELRAFPTDDDLPRDAINDRADEVFVPKAEVKLPEAKDFAAWKVGVVKQLRARCFRALPEKVPAVALVPKDAPGETAAAATEAPVTVRGITLAVQTPGDRTTWVVLNPDEDPAAALKLWLGSAGPDRRVAGLHARGCGPHQWTRKSPPNTVERSLALLGQTADAGRVRDVAAVLRGTRGRVRVVGRGPAGVAAAYAVLLSGANVEEVAVADPPASHRAGPHFLNVLRVLDVPEALGLLAPDVTLTLVGAKDPAFDRTAALYARAGAADKFNRE